MPAEACDRRDCFYLVNQSFRWRREPYRTRCATSGDMPLRCCGRILSRPSAAIAPSACAECERSFAQFGEDSSASSTASRTIPSSELARPDSGRPMFDSMAQAAPAHRRLPDQAHHRHAHPEGIQVVVWPL